MLAYEHGHRISDADVRAHFNAQLEATRRFDSEAMCAVLAKDFRVQAVEHVAGQQLRYNAGRDEACGHLRDAMVMLETLSNQTGGLFVIDFSYEITRLEVAPGGRRALVEATATAKLGDRLLWRTRSKENLSRAFWRVREHGGEAQSWMYVN
ncbi:MAG: hypothetical protein ABW163_06510 [Luteimonas sp.]